MVLLVLVAVIVYQRWRLSDNNAHLKAFISENMEMRERLQDYKHTGRAQVLRLNEDDLDVVAAAGVNKKITSDDPLKD